MSRGKRTQDTAAKRSAAKEPDTFSAVERAAMRERAKEAKAEARANKSNAAAEQDVLAKIAEMPEPERTMAMQLHALVKAAAPSLAPKTWYGMPAYAKAGKVLCFFQSAKKFGTRYASFCFSDTATLDDGDLWPVGFALLRWTPAVEARITALLRAAVR